MNFFSPFTAHFDVAKTLPRLQRTILEDTRPAIFSYRGHDVQMEASIASVAAAVESAYVLTTKDELPKLTKKDGFLDVAGVLINASVSVGYARHRANAWLAVAQYLEREEASKAYEAAKAKVVSDVFDIFGAGEKRKKRLNLLADEWFGRNFSDLGPNKTSVIEEIYRLETIIAEEGKD